MLNVNLNILKFLESINNFCLSLAHIGLEVRSQYSVISHQCQLFSPFSPQKRRLISRDNYAHRHEWENYDRVLGEGSLGQFDLIILVDILTAVNGR
ncbi:MULTISPECIES: hypothetical protein [Microcystis]|uniref:Uncharacterized protein n=1 Tax=Microcystis aeruginosa (strain NIES-843 / IAM M-2473) TaxID=449447 RepID=B0JXF3_MICAN|nr:unknown protein [Microcystis aeruginosa NIES-843]